MARAAVQGLCDDESGSEHEWDRSHGYHEERVGCRCVSPSPSPYATMCTDARRRHEIGHNFGAIHDCASGCTLSGSNPVCCPLTSSTCDSQANFIMYATHPLILTCPDDRLYPGRPSPSRTSPLSRPVPSATSVPSSLDPSTRRASPSPEPSGTLP